VIFGDPARRARWQDKLACREFQGMAIFALVAAGRKMCLRPPKRVFRGEEKPFWELGGRRGGDKNGKKKLCIDRTTRKEKNVGGGTLTVYFKGHSSRSKRQWDGPRKRWREGNEVAEWVPAAKYLHLGQCKAKDGGFRGTKGTQ